MRRLPIQALAAYILSGYVIVRHLEGVFLLILEHYCSTMRYGKKSLTSQFSEGDWLFLLDWHRLRHCIRMLRMLAKSEITACYRPI